MNEREGFTYRAFLLRVWNEDRDAPWRLTLEQAHSGERHHFATVQQLGAFLETIIEQIKVSSSKPDREDPGAGPFAGGG